MRNRIDRDARELPFSARICKRRGRGTSPSPRPMTRAWTSEASDNATAPDRRARDQPDGPVRNRTTGSTHIREAAFESETKRSSTPSSASAEGCDGGNELESEGP